MPELSNIQTYEKIEGTNFKPVLDRLSKVLKNVGLWNKEIEKSFDSFSWEVEDIGFVFRFIDLRPVASELSGIRIRPSILGYTSSIDSTFKDNWLGCDLLIETDELRNIGQAEYFPYVFEFVKELVSEMLKEFKHTGTYLTDEAQDGEDFDGIRCNDKSKLWQFDYAQIPLNLENLYSETPSTHLVKRNGEFFEALRVSVWNENVVSLFKQ